MLFGKNGKINIYFDSTLNLLHTLDRAENWATIHGNEE